MGEDIKQAIWHFSGQKPWDFYDSPLDMIYWRALALTAWQSKVFDELPKAIHGAFSNIFKEIFYRNHQMNEMLIGELQIKKRV